MDIVSNEQLYYNVVGRTMTTQYFTISAVIMFFWDWATHFDDEIKLVWMRDWSLAGKPLYLFLRYAGFAFQVYDLISMLGVWDEKFCKIYYYALAIGTVLFLYLIDILLAYRIVYLYQQRFRLLVIVNVTIMLLSATVSITIICYSLPLYRFIATPEHLTGCWANMPSYSGLSLAPPILFEVWIFLLALYKMYRNWREFDGVRKTAVIVNLLIRDQADWFFIVTAFIVWNVLQFMLAPTGLLGIALPFFRSIICICGCRLVLHIRKSYFSHNLGEEHTLSTTRGIIETYAPKFGLPPLPGRLQTMLGSDDDNDSEDDDPTVPRFNSRVSRHRGQSGSGIRIVHAIGSFVIDENGRPEEFEMRGPRGPPHDAEVGVIPAP